MSVPAWTGPALLALGGALALALALPLWAALTVAGIAALAVAGRWVLTLLDDAAIRRERLRMRPDTPAGRRPVDELPDVG